MKKVLLLPLIAIALHAEPIFFRPDGWTLGTEFPEPPTVSERTTTTPKGDVVELRAMHEKDGEVFSIERVLYPIPIPAEKRDAGYEGGKRGMLRASPGVLKSEEKIVVCGHEGRRYLVERKDGTRLTEHYVIIVGNEVYQFIHECFAKDSDSPEAKAFFSKIDEKKS
jgi:hypothetical protein